LRTRLPVFQQIHFKIQRGLHTCTSNAALPIPRWLILDARRCATYLSPEKMILAEKDFALNQVQSLDTKPVSISVSPFYL
jgi:hypothetical protein